jgi:hypothetical protein
MAASTSSTLMSMCARFAAGSSRRAASTAPESDLFAVETRWRMISCFQVFSSC